MSDSLAPIIARAVSAATEADQPKDSVHCTQIKRDWLLLTADTDRTGDRGQWIASNDSIDVAQDGR